MKVLKKKFKKILIQKKFKKVPGGDKLQYIPSTVIRSKQEGIVIKPPSIFPLKPIKIKKKLGRWCEYYEGRLPYPIECSNNKAMPTSHVFKDGKTKLVRDTSNCPGCDRSPSFIPWKRGVWDRIRDAIAKGEDLTDMESPQYGEYDDEN